MKRSLDALVVACAVLATVACDKSRPKSTSEPPDAAVVGAKVGIDGRAEPLFESEVASSELPRAARGDAVQTVFAVVITADGDVSIDEKKLDNQGLLEAAKKVKSQNDDVRAVIRADKDTRHGRVIEVLDLLKQAGIGKIAFAVTPVTAAPSPS